MRAVKNAGARVRQAMYLEEIAVKGCIYGEPFEERTNVREGF